MKGPIEMANSLPQWADAELSARLADVRARGEGPGVEFKERFPDQAHRLAQELAAFGTSGGGVLYIGINDNGDLVGIDAADGDTRDLAVERAQGVLSAVRPSLRANILLAAENGLPVLAIQVPPQDEPVFYYDHRPYIRDGRRSRPATPDEVKDRVWAHPSSEFRKRMEEIRIKEEETVQQTRQRFAERSADRSRMADEAMYRRNA
jgi:ATP-dependent DNA helicase RecG